MSFTIKMWSPFDSGGCTGTQGGPNSGGHTGSHWYIRYGMDLKAKAGTPVYAAFDGYVTKFDRPPDSSSVYGNQIFVRAHNNRMGGFYTHLDGARWSANSKVVMGCYLGTVMRDHLHMAIVEIIGGLPGGHYQGVDIFKPFLTMSLRNGYINVTFKQDYSAPVVQPL